VRAKVTWTPQRLAWLGLLMSWDEGQTLTWRWDHACVAAKDLHPHWKLGTSYSGFAEALVRETPRLVEAIKQRFRREMQTLPRRFWNCGEWAAFAVDGSRQEAPHTEANEEKLGCAGRDKTAPQVFITTVWHVGLGLPWDFRVGPGTDSERNHAYEMIDELPLRALLIADCGFVGYALVRKVLLMGRALLLRVGGNIRLLKNLGYYEREGDNIVYLWPQNRQRSQKPLVLRLIRLRQGKQIMYLLTNLMETKQLTDAQARKLYKLRWGEEVFYRSYKQTLERRTLLSRTAPTCLAESQWTLLGLWLLGLLTVPRIIATGHDPSRWSVAASRDLVRLAMRNEKLHRRRMEPLKKMLAAAVKDNYRRTSDKTARNYPRKKKEKPPGPPIIKMASALEIKRAKTLKAKFAPQSWTA
jgi:Transposase DDE domain